MKFRLFKLLLAITNALPLAAVHALGTAIGNLAWLTHNRFRAIAETNIRLCFPELDRKLQARLARRSLAESGKAILEGGKMWYGAADDVLALVRSVEGEQHIGAARQQGRGVILAVPHFGCWEIVGLYCARHYPLTALYVARGGPQIDRLTREARQRNGATFVPSNHAGLRAARQALDRHELVATLPDQSPTGHGEFAEFFGQPCYTMTLMPKLARLSGAQVLFVAAERLTDSSGYRLTFTPASEDIARLDLAAALRVVNRDTETLIRRAPQQYWWNYKRFKKRPDGAPPLY